FVPEFKHPEDLVPAEDEAPTCLLPPWFLSPRIRPLSPRVLRADMNAITSSHYHSLHPSGTPPLLPIPLSTPPTSRRAGILEADTPPQNRPLLATPRPGCEVGEIFTAAARRPGPTMAHGVDCSYVETRLRDTERRMMAALELVNLRASYQVDVCTRESSEFCTRHHDAQKDCAAVRAEIEVLRSERLAYEQESILTREALARSEAADDLAVQHIMRTQALEAGARNDTLEDIDKSWPEPKRDRLHHQPTNPNNPNNMTPEAVQTMIDQALLRNSSGGDGSYSLHAENPRNMHTARPCYYADFMKCHPLNFKGTEGAVGLTRWIEKMESVFNISGCAVENQVKFATFRDNDIPAYTNRFQELALICTKFVSNETEKVDKYISGLPDNIYRNVKSSKPKTLDETIELANGLMDQKLCTYAERKSDSKRKANDISRNNQQPFKKQNVMKAYNLGSAEKKTYEGNAPKCTKCQRNHSGPYTLKCHKCSKIGHYACNCRSTGNTNATNNQGGNGPNPRGNGCFECGNPRHFKRDCPKLKNKDGGNGNAQGWVYAMANAERNGNTAGNPDSNVITDLIPVELGSFDAIIGMDWLRRHHAMIMYDEKLVRVPFENKTLVFRGA
nr:hypothetical protein [Tanacetum cinerariifolium]